MLDADGSDGGGGGDVGGDILVEVGKDDFFAQETRVESFGPSVWGVWVGGLLGWLMDLALWGEGIFVIFFFFGGGGSLGVIIGIYEGDGDGGCGCCIVILGEGCLFRHVGHFWKKKRASNAVQRMDELGISLLR